VDFVASKHLTTNGRRGTKTLYAFEHVKCPLINRRGFMGFKLYPVEDGNEDNYKIFIIASENP